MIDPHIFKNSVYWCFTNFGVHKGTLEIRKKIASPPILRASELADLALAWEYAF